MLDGVEGQDFCSLQAGSYTLDLKKTTLYVHGFGHGMLCHVQTEKGSYNNNCCNTIHKNINVCWRFKNRLFHYGHTL